MSDKKRRDITLGEMQDECKKHEHGGSLNCTKCDPVIKSICDEMEVKAICFIDLHDPPRFNEAQMALLKVFYDRGFRKVITGSTRDALVDCIREFLGVGEGVSLDLAELLGKDGADEKT